MVLVSGELDERHQLILDGTIAAVADLADRAREGTSVDDLLAIAYLRGATSGTNTALLEEMTA